MSRPRRPCPRRLLRTELLEVRCLLTGLLSALPFPAAAPPAVSGRRHELATAGVVLVPTNVVPRVEPGPQTNGGGSDEPLPDLRSSSAGPVSGSLPIDVEVLQQALRQFLDELPAITREQSRPGLLPCMVAAALTTVATEVVRRRHRRSSPRLASEDVITLPWPPQPIEPD